ncbi:MAG: SDR family oxidoreductase [Alphaproteobacteria bacterium]|nr:SDR family oxidoreductase [Alphaproteobacteria bacterium]MBU1513318.1 SDR family oxidoreductase [Alphaproteobacteria bacterium]MBU2096310.1 SDR family oxidoreductase [Alphaproteobacteria bacterium]MBU2154037.1 SDR family oxidoreductase [Alphaproteobacteria bacterium]MBU2306182.1 SDR family oxidoreductase [Alphaproteobacteria bacterium]
MTSSQSRKIALVTGGNRGLGKDMALSLARMGMDVVLTFKSNAAEGEAVADEIRALGGRAAALRLDLSDIGALDGFVDRVKATLRDTFDGAQRLDFLVNNAGIGRAIPLDSLTEADFDAFAGVHFKGVLFLTQKTLRLMNDGGGVVFITAAADRYNVPGYGLYAACKGAIEVFSRYVAKEYGPRGIRSNTVAPGGVATDFNGGFIRDNANVQAMVVAQTPMGRLAEPHDIGGLVALLCSDDARWLTGQRLEATGGFNI